MVLGEIRKARSFKHHTIKAALIQPVARCLHRSVGDAIGLGLSQGTVKCDGLRGGMRQRCSPRALNPSGTQVDRSQF